MRVDEKATKAARAQHARGVAYLNQLFGFSADKVDASNIQTGRALESRQARRIWRHWRDKTFPARVRRRKHRKMQKASRRKNRRG